MKNKTKKPKYRLRLFFLYIGSFIVCVAPLSVYVFFNAERYIQTPTDTVKLCIGGFVALIFLFLKVIGKLGMPRRIVLFGVVFIMTWLLQSILADLLMLSGMALVGEFADTIFFQRAIRITKENILIGKTATVTAEQVEQIIEKRLGNGRV